ncbi:TPA: FAD-dependent oxidoreductase [Candidatus Galligastranaerophilus gallistercoris]|nr:FAD-dependent oxidoreductase [Candidatus Galligastranaerophilus gallistercoris]
MPKTYKYDFCITGGGPAGCAAAYIAAKSGLKCALIEKNNYLGGLMTGGLVIPVMKSVDSKLNRDFYFKLISAAKKYDAQIEYFDGNNGWFNPSVLKIVLDSLMKEAGVDVFFEMTPVLVKKNSDKVKKIKFSTNILSLYIEAKYYLDSTGDSKIFKLLNEKFYDKKSKKQPASLRFIMENVNIDKLKNFLLKIDSNFDVTNYAYINNELHLTSACTWDDKGWNLKFLFDKALKEGNLLPFDTSYFQIFTVAGSKSSIAFNCPRLRDFDPDNPLDYSNSIIEARASIFRIAAFMKKYFEGFENASISQIADLTGIRESNKIIAKKQFTKADILNADIPENPVLEADYPIDIHSNEKNSSTLLEIGKYYLDFNSLISKNYTNLFAAGRNLGADSYAQSALRIQSCCMSMGEAVANHVVSIINNC